MTGKTFHPIANGQNTGWMEEAGFVRVTSKDYKLPIGTWALDENLKEIGEINKAIFFTEMEGFALKLGKDDLGWSNKEMQVLFAQTRLALKETGCHAYYHW